MTPAFDFCLSCCRRGSFSDGSHTLKNGPVAARKSGCYCTGLNILTVRIEWERTEQDVSSEA